MAKDKADKPRKERTDKATKREKKVSRDAVEKSTTKAKKKSKRATTPESSADEDSDSSEGAPVVGTVSPLAQSLSANEDKGISGFICCDADNKKKKDKKEKKAEKKAKKEKKEKKAKTADTADTSDTSDEEDTDAPPLFMIDTKPTPVDPSATAAAESENEDGSNAATGDRKSKKSKNQGPPSGLNRATRRRIMLIERQRETIEKRLAAAAPEGSAEDRASEVQKELDVWTQRYDEKAAQKAEKARVRKAKEAARLKSKTGKALTGRRLKEREKQLSAIEKAAQKKKSRA
ncbi:hypothetical protein SLS62_000746 [Diatrype stigma]|uniref:Uncharacterized protein n=1 Tax=Diatrype stigma TaxID=117547 RepID=A0AAN9V1A7_9PEZI